LIIDNSNFVQYAIKAYDNPQCKTVEQFNDDVYKFSLIKKLLKTDKSDSEFVQMTLNNIVSLYNVFGYDECTKMLFFKVRREHWFKLKTYLLFLNHMPESIPELQLINSDIKICPKIAKELRLI
jgi:hypothetical protein